MLIQELPKKKKKKGNTDSLLLFIMAKLPSQITGHQFGYHQQAYVLEARQKVERTVRRKPLGNKRVSKLGVHVSWSLERPSLARIRYYS